MYNLCMLFFMATHISSIQELIHYTTFKYMIMHQRSDNEMQRNAHLDLAENAKCETSSFLLPLCSRGGWDLDGRINLELAGEAAGG